MCGDSTARLPELEALAVLKIEGTPWGFLLRRETTRFVSSCENLLGGCTVIMQGRDDGQG